MKVEELIRELRRYPPTAEVFVWPRDLNTLRVERVQETPEGAKGSPEIVCTAPPRVKRR